jgi:hypothetical protein
MHDYEIRPHTVGGHGMGLRPAGRLTPSSSQTIARLRAASTPMLFDADGRPQSAPHLSLLPPHMSHTSLAPPAPPAPPRFRALPPPLPFRTVQLPAGADASGDTDEPFDAWELRSHISERSNGRASGVLVIVAHPMAGGMLGSSGRVGASGRSLLPPLGGATDGKGGVAAEPQRHAAEHARVCSLPLHRLLYEAGCAILT